VLLHFAGGAKKEEVLLLVVGERRRKQPRRRGQTTPSSKTVSPLQFNQSIKQLSLNHTFLFFFIDRRR
jgi:hypothetical protein